MSNATQYQTTGTGFKVDSAFETYPKSILVDGSSMAFDNTHPETTIIQHWGLSEADTINAFGKYFWLFNSITGELSYGRWTLDTTDDTNFILSFLHVGGYPNFTTTASGAQAQCIAARTAAQFDVCSVKALSSDIKVNGVDLAAPGDIINIDHQGSANYPVVIDATAGQASVSNMRFIN